MTTSSKRSAPAILTPFTEGEIRERGWAQCVRDESVRRLNLARFLDASPDMRPKVKQLCRRDVLLFLSNFGWAFDPRDPKALPTPTILWDAQVGYVKALSDPDSGPLLVEKSRDQGASVLATQVDVWGFLFIRGWDVGYLTRIGADLDDKTYNSLFGKIDFMLGKLPAWLLPPGTIERRGGHAPLFKNVINGNVIRGANTTRGTMRGFRLKKLRVDEAAHIENLSAMMAGLQDVSPGITLISSVNGQGNAFADIRHSRNGYEAAPYGSTSRRRGAWGILRLHYSQDPRKDAAWAEEARRSKRVEDWAQEQEIEYNRSAKYRIFDAFDPALHVYDAKTWEDVEANHLHRGQSLVAWDFGSGASLTCYLAATYFKDEDSLVVHTYNVWQSAHYRTIADDYGADGWRTDKTPRGHLPDLTIGDRSGSNRDSAQQSWIKNFAGCGIHVKGRCINHFDRSRQAIQWALLQGKIMFAPDLANRRKREHPSLVESLLSWRYKIIGEGSDARGDKPDKDNPYSHLGDTFMYLADEIWGVQAEVHASTLSTVPPPPSDPVMRARQLRRQQRANQ